MRAARLAKAEQFMQAVDLLNSADRYLGKHLGVLLSAKTKAGYSSQLVSAASCKQAGRAANALLEAARLVASTR